MNRPLQAVRSHKKAIALAICLAGLLPVSEIVIAHHSNAMFDKTKVIEVTATVREFQWTNPHIWIEISIQNEDGEQEEWSIEGIGPNTLFRKGWRPNSFKPGDVVEFNERVDPARIRRGVGVHGPQDRSVETIHVVG